MLDFSRYLRAGASASRGPFLTGSALGLLAWAWFSQFLMTWGAGEASAAAIGVSILVAGAVVCRPGRALWTQTPAWMWLALAGWNALEPVLHAWTSIPRADLIESPSTALFAALTAALLTLTPSLVLIGMAVPDSWRAGKPMSRLLCGVAGAWMIAPLTVGAWPGAHATALTVSGWLLVRFAWELRQVDAAPASFPVGADQSASPAMLIASVIIAGCGGAVAVALQWVIPQLFLPTAALVCAAVAGCLIGAAWAWRLPMSGQSSLRRGAGICALLAVELSALAVAFPALLRGAMAISATVSWLPGILMLRSGIVAAMLIPCGLALGHAARLKVSAPGRISAAPLAALAAALAGWTLSWLCDVTLLSTPILASLVGAGALGLWLADRGIPSLGGWRGWTTPTLAAFAIGMGFSANPAAQLASQRVLFSGTHFQARAMGVSPATLPAIDDGRVLTSEVASGGVTTVWKHLGVQRVLRENGLTRGVISTQPDLCPQSIPEVITAVLPLTIHEQPHNVLVTSAAHPAVVAACLAFPIESVTALDDNAATLSFCRAAAEEVCPSLTVGDDRLHLRRCDPVRGVATSLRLYDVVIAPETIVGDLASARCWSVEHFRDVAAHLTPGGVFCQRVTCFDLNIGPVLDVIRTAQAAFPVVQLHEAAPGEWLLVARMQPELGLDRSYLERLERAHVREVLSQAGWDWSIMLSLKTVHPADLAGLTTGAQILTASNALGLYELPLDVMRWASKFDARRNWIAKHARPFGDALGEEQALADVSQRLSDVTLAQQIAIDHPDQFWAYRRYVRKRLQERPRPKVIQVAGEGLKNGLDPEDSRRKQYLSTLGKAAETRSREAIDQLIEYFSPFDPLVSPFIPREFVYIDRHSATPDPLSQWRCGLRSINYSPPSDRSVNNICDALETLQSHPEVAGDALGQWDAHNALLETLKNRWGLRIATGTTLKYDVADAERSEELATKSLEMMDRLRPEAGVSETDWAARREVLEKYLVRPVRSWRREQSARLALHAAAERRPEAIAPEKLDESR